MVSRGACLGVSLRHQILRDEVLSSSDLNRTGARVGQGGGIGLSLFSLVQSHHNPVCPWEHPSRLQGVVVSFPDGVTARGTGTEEDRRVIDLGELRDRAVSILWLPPGSRFGAGVAGELSWTPEN
jgi:hypothetical protein